jgi:phosphoenolpyruvate carboxylase
MQLGEQPRTLSGRIASLLPARALHSLTRELERRSQTLEIDTFFSIRKKRSTCHPRAESREQFMNELTKQQADDLRRTAEYLTLQMRLTPHPTERTRIRVMADTADFVAERIDAYLRANATENRRAANG